MIYSLKNVLTFQIVHVCLQVSALIANVVIRWWYNSKKIVTKANGTKPAGKMAVKGNLEFVFL